MKHSKQTFSFLLFFIALLSWAVIGQGKATAELAKPQPPTTPMTSVTQAAYAPLPHPAVPSGCDSAAQTFMANSLNTPITDLNTITSTMEISGLHPHLWDVNLFTNIQHTFPSDLDILLISPAGTEVTISTDNLGTNDDAFANTWWDDQWVGSSIADWPLATVAVVSPEEAMGAFIGEDPNGIWQLVIHDDQGGDVGVLVAWHLSFDTLSQVPKLTTSAYSGAGGDIPDLGQFTATTLFNSSGHVYDINVTTTITHPRTADLDIYLVSQGITITLASDVGGALANGFYGTIWDDSAGVAVTDWEFNGLAAHLVPENAMAAFNGLGALNNWTLVVSDDTPGNIGKLDSWRIAITRATCLGDAEVYQWQRPYPAPVGGDITYAVVVSNTGVTALNNVVLTDTLPVSTTFKSWMAAPGWNCQTPAVGSTGAIVCTTPSLAGGQISTHYLALASNELVPIEIGDNDVVVSTDDPEITLSNNGFKMGHYVGLTSANGNVWDVMDNRATGSGNNNDTGMISDGGQDAFDGWGRLQVLVADPSQNELANQTVASLNMMYGGGRIWTSQNSQIVEGVRIQRQLFAPSYADYVRYVDSFTNESTAVRHVSVAWGGNLGSDAGTTLAETSSGDLAFDMDDRWAVTIQNQQFNPAGPAQDDAPVGYLWRGQGDTSYQGTALYNPATHFTMPWPGNDEDDLGYVFKLTLQPGQTATLVYFLYRGLAEEVAGPGNTYWGEMCFINCVVPPAGSQIALAQTVLGQLAAAPDFCGLPASILATVANWPNATPSCPAGYPAYLPLIVR